MYLLLAFLHIFIDTAKALLMLVFNMHHAAWTACAKSVEAAQSLFNISLFPWHKSGYPSGFSRDASSPLSGRSHPRAPLQYPIGIEVP
ncbi:hypothetical protein TK06_05035 [Pseudomonas fluorescens]|jgi:hypothetical protein|uniref:Uncharacterized protein n=1 Tax=Pseudomonas fluorescens TaxID=294 RepID=A0A165YY44_PSEFL|nr:hypothetical protein TK06_05035 [Pseudomonas fluorescens]